jgi:hypothetical protein
VWSCKVLQSPANPYLDNSGQLSLLHIFTSNHTTSLHLCAQLFDGQLGNRNNQTIVINRTLSWTNGDAVDVPVV